MRVWNRNSNFFPVYFVVSTSSKLRHLVWANMKLFVHDKSWTADTTNNHELHRRSRIKYYPISLSLKNIWILLMPWDTPPVAVPCLVLGQGKEFSKWKHLKLIYIVSREYFRISVVICYEIFYSLSPIIHIILSLTSPLPTTSYQCFHVFLWFSQC